MQYLMVRGCALSQGGGTRGEGGGGRMRSGGKRGRKKAVVVGERSRVREEGD